MWIPNYFYLFGSFKTHPWRASGSSKITGRSRQKDSVTRSEYSNVLLRILKLLTIVPFLWWNLSDSCCCWRSHTPNAQQGSSLTLGNPFSCADSAKKKKEVSGKVSLPQIHHKFAIRDMKGFGSSPWSPTKEALLHLYWLLYFPPSHFIYRKKEGWPSSTVWMLDCYTPTASVARCW